MDGWMDGKKMLLRKAFRQTRENGGKGVSVRRRVPRSRYAA